MELQAIAGQLYVSNGQVLGASQVPGLLARSAPSNAARGRDRDFLFVHITLSGQEDETSVIAQDLLDTVSNRYYKAQGGVTAALRGAIIECNRLLLNHNLSGAAHTHIGAITCSVLRSNELFIAQAGEAFALLGHNFGIERLPVPGHDRITPLGQSAGIDIRFYHNWLQSGDMLLMADPRLAHLPTHAFDTVLTDTDIEDGLDELVSLVDQGSARAILVEFTDEAPGYLPDKDQTPTISSSGHRLSPPTRQPVRQSQTMNIEQEIGSTETTSGKLDVDVVETTARKATSKVAIGLSVVTAWLSDVLAKIRSPDEPARNSSGWAMPALIAIIIPIIVAVVVSGVYIQRGQSAKYGEIKRQISNTITQAQQATSDTEAEQKYQQAILLIEEAEQLRPGNEELVQFQQQVTLGLDNIAGVSRLQGQLIYQYNPGSNLTSVVVGEGLNGDVFTLDDANNMAYLHQLGEEFADVTNVQPEVIITEEQVIGSHIVGSLQDMMWRSSGNQVTRAGLAILDLRGALISYFPNFSDTRAIPLALASDWSQPVSITQFNERLYLLDPEAQAIWRYFAEGEGFTMSEGQRTVEFVDDANLDHAVDFAIYSEDGSIILVYDDGRLRRYVNGRLLWSEAGLASGGLETLLVGPTAIKIVGSGLNSSIFVLDPGSDRIVQFSLGGTFLAQYKAIDINGEELLGRASDFEIVENPLRIIIVAGNELYVATQNQ